MPTSQAKILARRRWGCSGLVALSSLAFALGSSGCDESSGVDALAQARERLMVAPRVVIAQGHRRVETYAPHLNVIEENGRVLNWANRRVEHRWREERSCYDSSTAFERADFRDQRRGALPDRDVDSARVVERSGRTVILWRIEDADRGPDRKGAVRLDARGRPVLVRARSLPWAGEPARPGLRSRISYPSRILIPRPSPLCSAL